MLGNAGIMLVMLVIQVMLIIAVMQVNAGLGDVQYVILSTIPPIILQRLYQTQY